MQLRAGDAWRWFCALPDLVHDALIYALASLFAIINGSVAASAEYREWGVMSFIPYLLATIAVVVLHLRSHRSREDAPGRNRRRAAIIIFLALTTVIGPLIAQLTWRATSTRNAHAQQEVAVIERAGDRLAAGHSPYPPAPSDIGVNPSSDSHSVDAASYFPYMPGMAVFGLLNATSLPPELGDARVLLVLASLLTFGAALVLSRASPARKIVATQFFLVLPTGALPMVTGGDDLPVIALMLLSLVLLARRSPFASGVVGAIACALKFTAWPIALLALLATRPHEEDRSTWRYLAGLSLLIPVVGVGLYGNMHAFVENAIRFPLGLTTIKSPAASPLVGQVLVSLMPHHRRVVTVILGVVGILIVGWALWRFRPRDVVAVTRFSAFVLCVATVLAPATRFGYLIYPTVLFVWSYVLTGVEVPVPKDEYAGVS